MSHALRDFEVESVSGLELEAPLRQPTLPPPSPPLSPPGFLGWWTSNELEVLFGVNLVSK